MTRLFGLGDEFGEDAILGKIEGMKDIIEQVNAQFKDPVRYSYITEILFLSFHCFFFQGSNSYINQYYNNPISS